MPRGLRACGDPGLGVGPGGARLPALPRRGGTLTKRSAKMPPNPPPTAARRPWLLALLGFAAVAGLTVLLLALLTNIFERKQEARQPFVRVVEVTEETLDPKIWGQNWPAEYDSYLKTATPTTTKYGGRGPGASDGGPAE